MIRVGSSGKLRTGISTSDVRPVKGTDTPSTSTSDTFLRAAFQKQFTFWNHDTSSNLKLSGEDNVRKSSAETNYDNFTEEHQEVDHTSEDGEAGGVPE